MEKYQVTIGLEIHAELKTKSKMFCGCANDADEKRPNVNICPVCMAHPGTLPVINREAVRKVLQVGAAVCGLKNDMEKSNFADFTEFDRKNYFYPDIPKDYQISQYKFPLISGGSLAGVELTRIHLEEDTARSSHDNTGDKGGAGFSLVDFNRAGVPLMELVTEPVIHSAEEVMNFGRELQLLLQYLGVSDANMEKGEMRVEVNISVAPLMVSTENMNFAITPKLGTKVEVKNINSFKSAGRAVEYEYKRHVEILEKIANGDMSEKIVQETRGFDEQKGVTFSQRSKEDSHDYRYFPDPDLPKIILSKLEKDFEEFSFDYIKKTLPETPAEKRIRYAKAYGLKTENIEIFVTSIPVGLFFEAAVKVLSVENASTELFQTLANYITSDIMGIIKSLTKASGESEQAILDRISPRAMAELMLMLKAGEVSSRGAKDIIKVLSEVGGSARAIAVDKGLIQKNDPEALQVLKDIIQKVLSDNPDSVQEYKNGKESLLQFFVGQSMKATKGSADPEKIKELILKHISAVQY